MGYKEVKVLFRKEFLIEWRQRYTLNGMLLYVGSTIFICYLSFYVRRNQLSPLTWNVLFWIIMLFTAVNAVVKSFMQEREERMMYYYTIVSPQDIIISKMLYNTVLLIVLSVTGFLFYSLVLGNPVHDMLYFGLDLILASIGFACTLTMVSGIAAKAGHNTTLMAILSFPVMIPILLHVIRISKNAIDGLPRSSSSDEILTLAAINILIGTVSYLLFPYVWRS